MVIILLEIANKYFKILGMILFNVARERIPYQVFNNSVFFAHKKKLKHFDLKTKEETVMKELDYQ